MVKWLNYLREGFAVVLLLDYFIACLSNSCVKTKVKVSIVFSIITNTLITNY